MLYQLKQKIWSWGDKYTIRDAQGEPVFQVVGKVFSWGDSLSFQDMSGEELARIEQRLFKLLPQYEIRIQGELFAEIRQEWSWLKKKFTLDVPGPNDYTITGSFWQYEFEFERNGSVIARTSKEFFSWGDTYGIDITEDENHLALLCTTVMVDLVCHDHQGAAAANGAN